MNELLSWMVEYNWMALALWALAFVVGFFGVLLPLVGFGQRILWNFIDEQKKAPNLFFKWVYKEGVEVPEGTEKLNETTESLKNHGYAVVYMSKGSKVGYVIYRLYDKFIFDDGASRFWVDIYHSSFFVTKKAAEKCAKELPQSHKGSMPKQQDMPLNCILDHALNVVISVVSLVVVGALLNFLMYPTLLIGSIVATVYGMRSLRRVQKKTVEILTDLKTHRSQSAEEAHPPKDAA